MSRRFARVVKYTWQEEDFAGIAGAALGPVIIGTLRQQDKEAPATKRAS